MRTVNNYYDVIIVGAGPAGLTAGIYTARSGLKTLILEEKFTGGLMAEAPLIENYPGLQGSISGLELANRMEKQGKKFGAQINSSEKVVDLELKMKTKIVKTEEDIYRASVVIIAIGCKYKQLDIPGENEFRGKGVSYCVTCDGPFFKGKRVLVVGGGNSAATTAIHLSTFTSDVKIIHRRNLLRADTVLVNMLENNNVDVILNTVVKKIGGGNMVENVTIEDVRTGENRIIEIDGVFVQIGEEPYSLIAKDAGIKTNEEGYIVVDDKQRTNLNGVYAAGDVTDCPVKQVGTAVGQAIIAAVEAFEYIKKL